MFLGRPCAASRAVIELLLMGTVVMVLYHGLGWVGGVHGNQGSGGQQPLESREQVSFCMMSPCCKWVL